MDTAMFWDPCLHDVGVRHVLSFSSFCSETAKTHELNNELSAVLKLEKSWREIFTMKI